MPNKTIAEGVVHEVPDDLKKALIFNTTLLDIWQKNGLSKVILLIHRSLNKGNKQGMWFFGRAFIFRVKLHTYKEGVFA